MSPRGLLAIHISSRYLDLEPILGNLAADAGRTARIWRDNGAVDVVGKFASVWVVMARSPEDLGPLAGDPSLAAAGAAMRGRFGPTISPMSPGPCGGNRPGCT